MKRLFGRRPDELEEDSVQLELEAERGRGLGEESREVVVVLDEEGRGVSSSGRARQTLTDLTEGEPLPARWLDDSAAFTIEYEVDGRTENLLYLRDVGDLAAYEELRAGFTAAVSHELRTPLARLLSLLESGLLPDADVPELINQAQAEVSQMGELIDDVLFLSELESGREVVAFGMTPAVPILREVLASSEERAERAGVSLSAVGNDEVELPLRPRMIRVVAGNLAENAIRYAGPDAVFTLLVERKEGAASLTARDTGIGVAEEDLPRLFERFYRADRARVAHGTGLGLAIVKHVVTAAGGSVEALSTEGHGLTIRCVFPDQ